MKLRISGALAPCQPDPYVIASSGRYYLYATGAEGVAAYCSDNGKDFTFSGYCLKVPGQKEYWAPAVLEWEGKFYLYYSSIPAGCDDVHQQRLKVAVSDRPDGGFRYVRDLAEPFSIDAHVVDNGFGELYLYYSVNDYEAERAGTYIVVDRMLSPLVAEGKPAAVVRPTLDEEIFQRDRFRQGQHWHTLEGAFYLREGGYHYVMYSGNCYENETYYVGYAVATGKERDLRKLRFTKYPNEHTYAPLLARSEELEGTGHNSAIKIDGQWYIVYHARDRSVPRMPYDTRTAYMDKLIVDSGVLKVEKL